jgi:hypothetical protein
MINEATPGMPTFKDARGKSPALPADIEVSRRV